MVPDAVGELLAEDFGLDKEKPLLIGVSGGPDSLCLLDVLNKAGYQIIVAHFNHMLRPTSGLEAERVASEAQRRGLQFLLGCQDIAQDSREKKLSIEESARLARYQFLFQQAALLDAQAVAVGHNADDQVETVLMHFLRGSGLDGLSGMQVYSLPNPWSNDIPLIRPLLGIWRSEIEAYCRSEDLSPVQDETNAETTYFRNRLRHELIPQLGTYNRQFKQRVLNMADVLRKDAEFLSGVCETAWEECIQNADPNWIIINRSIFNKKDVAIRRLLLRKAMNKLAPDMRDVVFSVIDRGIHFIEDPTNGQRIDLAAGFVLEPWLGDILIHPADVYPLDPGYPQMDELEITVHDQNRIALGKGWYLAVNHRNHDENQCSDAVPTDGQSVWLDADEVIFPLVIRTQKPGDRLNPLGMGSSTQKVSDIFTNRHIPAAYRSAWPLVFSQDRLIWIPGIKPAEFCRVKKTTRKVLTLRVEKDLL
jgi:tRNA(Ile)-lysidine synthase